MQRVTRDTRPAQDDPRVLEQAMAIIVRHFPASIAHLYATPRTGQDGVREWWSPLEGQPQRYHDLTGEQQATLLRVYDQRQDALRQLVGELKERGQEQEASVLRALIGPANLEHLYSVNGEPLLVRWAQPAPVKPAPVAAAPVPAPRPRRWIWLPWFLLPLLGLLLLALALWFGWPYLQRWYEQREPWFNYRIGLTVSASQELGIHREIPTLFLANDLTGNSELCSLFLQTEQRNGCNGRLLSKARLLFIAEFRELFADKVIAEMRGNSDDKGRSPFWESLGRHFFKMDFSRADYLTGLGNKSFVAELMPKFPLYTCFLSAEARATAMKQ